MVCYQTEVKIVYGNRDFSYLELSENIGTIDDMLVLCITTSDRPETS